MMQKTALELVAKKMTMFIMDEYEINTTLAAFIDARCWDGKKAKTTKALREELVEQLKEAKECALEMGRDNEKDQQQEDQNDNDNEDNCSV